MRLPFDATLGAAPCFGVDPFETLPDEAQELVPFPVFEPTDLPAGSALTSCLVTPEGPDRASRVELVITGSGRRLHLAQFHHDWWRPTLSDSHLLRVRDATRAGAHILFWGRTKQGRAAACTTIGRTQIELTVARGTFVDLELSRLVAGLIPALPDALPKLATIPFHHLSFHIRAGRGPGGIDELAAAQWYATPAAFVSPVPVLTGPWPAGWQLESCALWPAPPPTQVQWLVKADSPYGPSTVLYARARPLTDEQPLPLPPALGQGNGWRQRAQHIRRPGRGRSWFATQHSHLGGWMVAWEEPPLRAAYQLFVRAGALPDSRSVLDLVAHLHP